MEVAVKKDVFIIEGLKSIIEAEGYNAVLMVWLIEREWAQRHGLKAPPLPREAVKGATKGAREPEFGTLPAVKVI